MHTTWDKVKMINNNKLHASVKEERESLSAL